MAVRPRTRLRTGLFAGLVLASALAAGWSVVGYAKASGAADSRDAAVAAARQAMTDFVEVDPKSLDAGLRRVADSATGEFRTEFEKDRATLRAAYAKNGLQAHGEVLEAGVVAADDDSVTVLVALEQTVRTGAGGAPQQRHYRVRVEMVPGRGRWLVSSLEFVG
jgi:Mce-associated membrane protein